MIGGVRKGKGKGKEKEKGKGKGKGKKEEVFYSCPLAVCTHFRPQLSFISIQSQTQQELLPNGNLGARFLFFSPHNNHYQIIFFGVCNRAFCAPSPADQSNGQVSDCPPVSMYIIITPFGAAAK